jgi:hypothetical protein
VDGEGEIVGRGWLESGEVEVVDVVDERERESVECEIE